MYLHDTSNMDITDGPIVETFINVDNIPPFALKIFDDVPIKIQIADFITYYDNVNISMNDVLWLARVAISETKDIEEAYHIMWVVRNRVDTNYRRKSTYKDVILDPYQFSTFNPTNNRKKLRRKNFYLNLDYDSDNYGNWHIILKMASVVLTLDESWNPYESNTRHFVHQAALKNKPNWLKSEPDAVVNTLSIYEGI